MLRITPPGTTNFVANVTNSDILQDQLTVTKQSWYNNQNTCVRIIEKKKSAYFMSGTNNLNNFFTVKQAAEELKLAEVSIRRMVCEGKLSSRPATTDEMSVLLAQGTIRGVPGRGICLISRESVEKKRVRKEAGRPKAKTENA